MISTKLHIRAVKMRTDVGEDAHSCGEDAHQRLCASVSKVVDAHCCAQTKKSLKLPQTSVRTRTDCAPTAHRCAQQLLRLVRPPV